MSRSDIVPTQDVASALGLDALFIEQLPKEVVDDLLEDAKREIPTLPFRVQRQKRSEAQRAASKARKQRRAAKAAQGLLARQKGRSAWKAREKRIGKSARAVEREHPGADGRKVAKLALQIESELIHTIEANIIPRRASGS